LPVFNMEAGSKRRICSIEMFRTIEARPENFKPVVFDRVGEEIKIRELDIREMEFKDFQAYVKRLWG
jgi:hypothetical protein